jgi:hypothetical protein
MPQTHVVLDARDGIPELEAHKDSIQVARSIPVMAVMPQGMTSGDPSVMMFIEQPDGKMLCAETSLKLFLTVAAAFKAKYGHPDDKELPVITGMDLNLALEAMEAMIGSFPVDELRSTVMGMEAIVNKTDQHKFPSGRSVSSNTRRARIFLDFFDELERWRKDES